jgi:hydroxyacylglutathione hydrolase
VRVLPVACLSDNYAYVIVGDSGEAVVVDASEAAPVRDALRREGVRLAAIWSTHHHWDHVGGNEELAREFSVDVVGHASDRGRLPGLTQGVAAGDVVRAGGIEATCLHVPGHTLGAIAYHLQSPRAVFTGDTLFCAGCGRLFEGTPAQMHASLSSLARLPGETRVYCGHEYTENNLRFAAHVEPSNADVTSARARAASQRSRGEPTIGTTLDEERRTNPFLRAGSRELRFTLGIAAEADEVTAFAAVRAAKDGFK